MEDQSDMADDGSVGLSSDNNTSSMRYNNPSILDR